MARAILALSIFSPRLQNSRWQNGDQGNPDVMRVNLPFYRCLPSPRQASTTTTAVHYLPLLIDCMHPSEFLPLCPLIVGVLETHILPPLSLTSYLFFFVFTLFSLTSTALRLLYLLGLTILPFWRLHIYAACSTLYLSSGYATCDQGQYLPIK